MSLSIVFFLMIRRPPRSTRTDTLFPYTTLFRSYTHPGQTEFIAERCGVAATNAVMMLAGPALRVVPLTVHIPLAEVPERLTGELIVAKARIVARGLRRDFAVAAPRLAIAGLNPHAGESGRLGAEEIRSAERRVGKECVCACGSR